jgi:predicted RNA-binding protein with PIN domain
MIIFGNGAMRISAAELKARVSAADRAIREFLDN